MTLALRFSAYSEVVRETHPMRKIPGVWHHENTGRAGQRDGATKLKCSYSQFETPLMFIGFCTPHPGQVYEPHASPVFPTISQTLLSEAVYAQTNPSSPYPPAPLFSDPKTMKRAPTVYDVREKCPHLRA